MWCRHCHQEVAGVPDRRTRQPACPVCQQLLKPAVAEAASEQRPQPAQSLSSAPVAAPTDERSARTQRVDLREAVEAHREIAANAQAHSALPLPPAHLTARQMSVAASRSSLLPAETQGHAAATSSELESDQARQETMRLVDAARRLDTTVEHPLDSLQYSASKDVQPSPMPDPGLPLPATTSLENLDRELDAVEAILNSWCDIAPMQRTTEPVPQQPAERLPTVEPIPQKADPALAAAASTKVKIASLERQGTLLVMAQVTFFVSAAIAAAWSLSGRGEWLLGHLIGVSVTGQICTLFCLAWFVSKLRGVLQKANDAELQLHRAQRQNLVSQSLGSSTNTVVPSPKQSHRKAGARTRGRSLQS